MRYKLRDIFDLQMGKTPSRNNPNYWNSDDHKWISIADLSKTGKYISETKECLSECAIEESGIKAIPANTVIMSFKLSIGKTAITAEDMYSNEAIMAFYDKHVAELLPEYIYYLFTYKNWNEGSNKAVMGKTLNKTTLSEVEIDICSVERQREIIEVLDRTKQIVSDRENQVRLFATLIRARFVEMFGNPISNPKGWDKVILNDCLDSIDNGKSPICAGNARIGENPAILKLSAVSSGIYRPDENKAIININDFIENAEVHNGDLLFTRKNTPELVGMATYVFSTPKNLMMPDLIFRLNTKEICSKIFLWQLINHNLFRGKVQNIASGSAKSMSNISKERLGKMSIYLPPIELQNQFAEFVKATDKSKIVGFLKRTTDTEMYMSKFDSIL